MTATDLPASGREAAAVGLVAVGEIQHGRPVRPATGRRRAGSAAGCRGRSSPTAGRRVMRAFPVAAAVASQDVGQGGDERVGLLGGQDQRRRQPEHVRGRRVDDEAGLAGGESSCRRRRFSVSTMPSSRPAPRTLVDQRVVEILDAGGDVLAQRVDMVEQAVALDGVEHGQRGRGAHRVAGEGRAVLAGLQQVAPPRRCRSRRRSAGRRRDPWPG